MLHHNHLQLDIRDALSYVNQDDPLARRLERPGVVIGGLSDLFLLALATGRSLMEILANTIVRWNFTARGPDGHIKWQAGFENLVTNVGLNHWLDALTANNSAVTYSIGLISASPTVAAGDTMSSHAGWTEITAYDEATRVTCTLAAASGQARTNSAAPAVFTISSNGTSMGGGFLTTNNTKGGTTGTLLSAGAFTAGDKSLDDNDTLTVTATLSLASA